MKMMMIMMMIMIMIMLMMMMMMTMTMMVMTMAMMTMMKLKTAELTHTQQDKSSQCVTRVKRYALIYVRNIMYIFQTVFFFH